MAIIETAFSLASEPTTETILALRQAVAGGAPDLDFDEIAFAGAVAELSGATSNSGLPRSTGIDAQRAVGDRAEHAERGVRALLEHLHDPRGVGGAGIVLVAEGLCENAVADAGRRAAAHLARLDRDDHRRCPCASRSAGRASRMPSASREKMSSTATWGRAARPLQALAVLFDQPSTREDRPACPSARRDPRP